MGAARVLLVDDDRILTEILAQMLTINGFDVEVADNGLDAVEKARAREFDIAFMDVHMPVMNGIDSFLEIRKLRPDARIVMMTAGKEQITRRAIEAGALGPLRKPFEAARMIEMINSPTAVCA